MIIQNINQFKDQYLDTILTSIKNVGGTPLSPTVSLCHQCHYHIPAYRYELENKIYISKHCAIHGISHHLIENDAEFYHGLIKNMDTMWNFDSYILTEVTDRCNLECPHCYHLPDNKIKDVPLNELVDRFKTYPDSLYHIILAGAESSLRKDLKDLVVEISRLGKMPQILTNGVKFADVDFVKNLASANVDMTVTIGLNHPSYIGNSKVREKQIQGILNVNEYINGLSYVGYTMVSMDELDYILTEITTTNWCQHSRIRAGSEIGRNATDDQIFVSDIFKAAKVWAETNNKSFEIIDADNNIYHIVVKIDDKYIRIIQWCDETNIDMEELCTGPWCDFVPDGITNFLNQVIRRDVWKNKNIILPDSPPLRYQVGGYYDPKNKLWCSSSDSPTAT